MPTQFPISCTLHPARETQSPSPASYCCCVEKCRRPAAWHSETSTGSFQNPPNQNMVFRMNSFRVANGSSPNEQIGELSLSEIHGVERLVNTSRLIGTNPNHNADEFVMAYPD